MATANRGGFSPARRAVNGNYATSRSVRIADDVWELAKRRATHDGYKMSGAIQLLVEAYGKGLVDLPKVRLVPTNKT